MLDREIREMLDNDEIEMDEVLEEVMRLDEEANSDRGCNDY